MTSIETNTEQYGMDASTNTEGSMLDIETANKLVLEFIDDKIEREQAMAELVELYNVLRTQLEQLQSI